MVQYQLKLRPSISQETQYDQWLFHSASVYSWAVRKIELGPTGLTGLSVRHWSCPCGAEHDRDVHAAVNTLITAAGYAVEVDYA